MERVAVQPLAWRLFAVFVALLLALVGLASPVIPAPGFTLAGAKAIYWLLAPLGLLGYAYGFRLFGQTFWRFYAVIFTAEIALRFGRLILTGSSHPAWLMALVFAAIVLICLALLRHANIIGAGDRPDLAEVFR